jgi:hypothetical protein
MNLASVAVGRIVSFVFMWPFALLTLEILPFMAFGARAKMQMYMGEDVGTADGKDGVYVKSFRGIVVYCFVNIKIVTDLTLEDSRKENFSRPCAIRTGLPSDPADAVKGRVSFLRADVGDSAHILVGRVVFVELFEPILVPRLSDFHVFIAVLLAGHDNCHARCNGPRQVQGQGGG